MKKFYTLLAALAISFAMNAESVTWYATDTGAANNDTFADNSFVINDNLSVSFAQETGGNPPKYRSVSSLDNPIMLIYRYNSVTINATNASITSISFDICTEAKEGNTNTSDTTPDWGLQIGDTTLGPDNNTWTGSATSIVATCTTSKTAIVSFTVEYTTNGGSEPPTSGGDDNGDDNGDTYTGLFFTENLVGTGEAAQYITLAEDGITIAFSGTSTGAQVDASNGYFGTADNFETIPYRYRPGGSSTKGIESTYKATLTLESKGVLTIYASYNADPGRTLQVVDATGETLFSETLSSTLAVQPSGQNKNVYPIYNVEVPEGTSYILWPDGQVFFYGFSFEASDDNGGTTEPENPDPDDPNQPGGDDNGDDTDITGLFFTEDQVSEDASAVQNITLSADDVTIDFVTTSTSAKLIAGNGYFGTADSYITLPYKYQPNGTSSNGTSSNVKATCTFPSNGELIIYVYNSTANARRIQLVQNEETIFEQNLISTDAVTPDGKNISVYPIYSTNVEAGTAYILWPDGGITFYGFEFIPSDETGGGTETPDPEDPENPDPDDPDDPEEPVDPIDPSIGGLFFSQDLVGTGAAAQNVTIKDENTGIQITYTTSSSSAEIDNYAASFGTLEDYTTLEYRYRPGGNSANGINSSQKGEFYFPTDGTLTIYAFNTSVDGDRRLQIVDEMGQDIIWEQSFSTDDYVSPATRATKIYPVYTTTVTPGTFYLLWPDGQLMLYGFGFEAGNGTSEITTLPVEFNEDAPAYDLFGRRVNKNYKGIIIQNGKKIFRR